MTGTAIRRRAAGLTDLIFVTATISAIMGQLLYAPLLKIDNYLFPIFPYEMILAAWLIFKGYTNSK